MTVVMANWADSQDLRWFFCSNPNDRTEVELFQEGKVELGRLGGAIEA